MMVLRRSNRLERDIETGGSAGRHARRTLILHARTTYLQSKSVIRPSTRLRCARIGLSLMGYTADMEISANSLMGLSICRLYVSLFIKNTSPRSVFNFMAHIFVLMD